MAFLVLVLLLLLLSPLLQLQLQAQQSYVDNKQLNCYQNPTTTLGFLCNGPTSCPSYLTFRSTPTYNTPATIAHLLTADPSQIAAANNISDVDPPLPADTLLIVPINCSCSRNYYQHNASYVLKRLGETYFAVANDTYQALITFQAMEAQNPYDYRRLFPEMKLTAPLRCACLTPNQTASGYNYLLTYRIRQSNDSTILPLFRRRRSRRPGHLGANMLTQDHLIYFFTPLLAPLKTQPTKLNINTAASPPTTSSPS